MNIKQQLRALQDAMQAIVDAAKSAGRDVTDTELAELEAKAGEAQELKAKIDRAEKSMDLARRIGEMKTDQDPLDADKFGGGTKGYMSLAGSAAKSAAEHLATRGQKGIVAATPIPLAPQSPIELGKRPTSILEVLRVTQQPSPVWRYPRQTVRQNNAAIVAPGAEKPRSVVETEMVDGELRVFAHISNPVDEYVLSDSEALGRFLSAEMNYMLLDAIEDEVLNGDGTTGHLAGILNTSGVQLQAFDTDPLTSLRMAALKAENVGRVADVFVVHPADWATIETARNTSGAFDLGSAVDRAAQKVWGTQVVTSNRLTPGEAVALDLSALGLDTDTTGIQTKWNDAVHFSTNEVLVRVEGRFGVSVFIPNGIVKVAIAAS